MPAASAGSARFRRLANRMDGAAVKRLRLSREMSLRIASAVVLIPFGLFVVWQGGAVLALACGVFAAVMGREWARMAALNWPVSLAVLSAIPVLVAGFAPTSWHWQALGAVALLGFAVNASNLNTAGVAAFGALYCAMPPLAMFLLREGPEGLLLTLVSMVFVWVTDIAAFFGGRTFAGPLLSPKESPNKRWSGAVAAFAATVLFGAALALICGWPLLPWCVAALSLSVAAQLGDLLESRFKRSFGVKDAGGIIPGHGGLLDRVDGLGAAMCYALMVLTLAPEALILLGFDA
jgi:phosphatidate cytidylyltransferase